MGWQPLKQHIFHGLSWMESKTTRDCNKTKQGYFILSKKDKNFIKY